MNLEQMSSWNFIPAITGPTKSFLSVEKKLSFTLKQLTSSRPGRCPHQSPWGNEGPGQPWRGRTGWGKYDIACKMLLFCIYWLLQKLSLLTPVLCAPKYFTNGFPVHSPWLCVRSFISYVTSGLEKLFDLSFWPSFSNHSLGPCRLREDT